MNTRRKFFSTGISAAILGMLPYRLSPQEKLITTESKTILPKALKKGDTIGLIAPGYAFPQKVLQETVETIIDLGYKPYYTEQLLNRHGYFSNTDENRAGDINHMFRNPKVDVILCIRGGYGCTRLMELIDYDLILKNPKALIGFSDVTALLNGIHQTTGLVTYHGPVGSTLNHSYTINQFKEIVTGKTALPVIKNAPLETKQKYNPEYERYTITPGSATGVICGGSLTLINALIGTPHEIDFTNKLVFIEDIDEAPYRIDRMLTQLIEGKTFKNAAAVIFGVCAGCNESTNPNSFTLKEVLVDLIQPLGMPAAYGMSFGHIKQNFTFPIGINASFETEKMTITLLEKYIG